MENQLSLLSEKGIEIGGIRLSNAALTVPEDATPSDLEAIGRYLKFSARGSQWHWGDYIIAVSKRHEDRWDAASTAKAWGQDEDKLRDALAVAGYYPAADRREVLSFNHHLEAMAAGSLEKSLAALDMARERDWYKIDLRAHLRATAAVDKNPEMQIDDERDVGPVRDLWVQSLGALERAASKRIAAGWTPDADTAQSLLKKTKNLRELLKSIEEAAGIAV